jgi:hypothetical protein
MRRSGGAHGAFTDVSRMELGGAQPEKRHASERDHRDELEPLQRGARMLTTTVVTIEIVFHRELLRRKAKILNIKLF